MKLNQLPKTTTRSKTRVGRGIGSNQGGHTTGRGQKGQKSRNSVPLYFEGGQLPLTKRMPYLRGKSRFNSLAVNNIIINLSDLESFKDGATITKESLVTAGLISLKEAADGSVKILGTGDLTKSFKIAGIITSKSALAKIEKAGGSVEAPEAKPIFGARKPKAAK